MGTTCGTNPKLTLLLAIVSLGLLGPTPAQARYAINARLNRATKEFQKSSYLSYTKAKLTQLVKMPAGRNALSPKYIGVAQAYAKELKKLGLKPLGTGKVGLNQYLQAFSLEQAYTGAGATQWFGGNRMYNVVAVLPGKGNSGAKRQRPGKPREAILVTTHLDGPVWDPRANSPSPPNANDNASGAAGMLSVAKVLAAVKRKAGNNRRDVIFIGTGGEEQGIKGIEAVTRYLKTGNTKIVGEVNLDSIGRGDVKGFPIYAGETPSAAAKNPVGKQLKKDRKVRGAATLAGVKDPAELGLGWISGDHAPFGNMGKVIPAVGLGGLTQDLEQPGAEIHSPNDTLDKIDPKTIAAVAARASRGIIRLANTKKPAGSGASFPLKNPRDFAAEMYERYSFPVHAPVREVKANWDVTGTNPKAIGLENVERIKQLITEHPPTGAASNNPAQYQYLSKKLLGHQSSRAIPASVRAAAKGKDTGKPVFLLNDSRLGMKGGKVYVVKDGSSGVIKVFATKGNKTYKIAEGQLNPVLGQPASAWISWFPDK